MNPSEAATFDEAVLVVALVLPLVGLVPALLALDLRYVGRWSRLGALGAAAAWLVVVVRARAPELGPFRPDALAAAGAAGAALLASARRRPPLGVGIALAAVGAGLAATTTVDGTTTPSAVGAGLGLAAACALAGANRPLHPWTLAAGAASGAAVVGGLALLERAGAWTGAAGQSGVGGSLGTGRPAVAGGVLLALGAAALALACAARPGRPLVLVLPAVLVTAVRGLPWLAERGAGTAVAVALAAGAVGVANGRRDRERWPAGAVAVWAVVAAVGPVPGMAPAAGLLAAGVVLGTVLRGPAAVALTALPGAAAVLQALTSSLAADPTWEAGALVVLALATAAGFVPAPAAPAATEARAPEGRGGTHRLGVAEGAALVLALWLALAPGAWWWVGAPDLAGYEEGIATGIAVMAIVLVGNLLAVARHHPAASQAAAVDLGRVIAAGALAPQHDPDAVATPAGNRPAEPLSPVAGLVALVARPQDHSQWAAAACLAGLGLLGLATAALVVSAVS